MRLSPFLGTVLCVGSTRTPTYDGSLKAFLQAGCIKHEEVDLLPQVAFVLAADDADCPLELLASQPQFAIQRYIGQAGYEPVRGVENITECSAT